MRSWFLTQICLCLAASCASTSEPSPEPALAKDVDAIVGESDYDPDEVVCIKTKQTGSRLGGERTCKTRRSWDEIARNARDGADDATRRALQTNPKSN